MKRNSILNWSSSAITAKVFIPVTLLFIAGIVAASIHDLLTAVWRSLILLPLAVSAIWIFLNIGDISPSTDGVCYRQWLGWRSIRLDQIRNVIPVLPCLAAIVLPDGEKLYFFPDPDTTRHLRALSERTVRTENSPGRNERTLLRQVLVLAAGVAIGIAVRWIPQLAVTKHPNLENSLTHVWQRYLPWFVGASLIYLAVLVITRRLKGKQLYISLALIGIGAVYVCGTLLSFS